MNVSVIIPIYGVEQFIERCAESLMQQSLVDVEYIFVDDCTTDNSIAVLQNVLGRYPTRKSVILRHETNKGLPSARNTGLAYASGDYVIHCDGDDYLELDTLKNLYDEAIASDADIVWCDFYEDYRADQSIRREPSISAPDDAIKAMLSGTMRFNVWNKLCKRSLYTENDIRFPDGHSMGEDMTMMKLFVHAKRLSHITYVGYHYVRSNTSAMTRSFSRKHIEDDIFNVMILRDYIVSQKGAEYISYINYFTLWTKFKLLLSDGRNGEYGLWAEWAPESHMDIPGLPNANRRIRFLMHEAASGHWWFVWAHYWLVIRCYYGLVYRGRQ